MTPTDQAVVDAARGGDEHAFARLVGRHKRELHVHCYRMVGSFEEAEDLVQETFLRAWRNRESFHGGPGFRAWLYRIATNASLDAIRRGNRQLQTVDSLAEVPWLQPYPDRLLDEIAPREEEPDAVLVARETIELGLIALFQVLPPRQRAVLILRDVLEWSAAETAELLETSVASVNSALQRARATLGDRAPGPRAEWSAGADVSDEERELLRRFIDTHERHDVVAAAAVMAEDIRVTMPPEPLVFDGRDSLRPLWERAFGPDDEWRLVPTAVNRMPAAASYHRRRGEHDFRAFKLDVLRCEDGLIREVTTFDATLFPELGLQETLPAGS